MKCGLAGSGIAAVHLFRPAKNLVNDLREGCGGVEHDAGLHMYGDSDTWSARSRGHNCCDSPCAGL